MNSLERIKVKKILFWYAFLRLSVSYRDAQMVDGGIMNKEAAMAKHVDFEKVIYWYSKTGRVWRKNPIDLFFENSNLFSRIFDLRGGVKVLSILGGEKGEKTEQIVEKLSNYVRHEMAGGAANQRMLISIPFKLNKKNIYEQINSALNDYLDDLDADEQHLTSEPPTANLMTLAVTKIRMEVLERCYNLIVLKALHPKISALEQARMLGVSAEKVALLDEALALRGKVGKTAAEYDKVANINEYQINIRAVVWKYTRRAYLLAENAARGDFPSFKDFDPNKTTPEFAYEHIAEMAGQIRQRFGLDGIEKPFTDEFLSAEQIERCYNTFPKYYEVEDEPRKQEVTKSTMQESVQTDSTLTMARYLKRIGKAQMLEKSAVRRKSKIEKAMAAEAAANQNQGKKM
jgi:hypothetical protein